MSDQNLKIAVIGLGYVGLPVAVAFADHFQTVGFDINQGRIASLKDLKDLTGQIQSPSLKKEKLSFTSELNEIKDANFYVLAIPTPVDDTNTPDLTLLRLASEMIGQVLSKGDIVIYESTVYPGATEEVCLPLLEKSSGLTCGTDFKIGYSPERLNPGDDEHDLAKIIKLVAAQDPETLETAARVYEKIVPAGIHKVSGIKVAEASKVIENTQRDLNIALMNELAIIFDRMNIDTHEVIEAAATKWNFTKYTPGLVGGHCIGVDPYYLTFKSQQLDYHPEVILAGRRINDYMGKFIAEKTLKELIRLGHHISESNVAIFGLAYKENCTDTRNSKTFDIIQELKDYKISYQVNDYFIDKRETEEEYGLSILELKDMSPSEALIFAVPHKDFLTNFEEILDKVAKPNSLIVDVKGKLDKQKVEARGLNYWRL